MATPATARRIVTPSRATSITRLRLSDLGSKASIPVHSAAFKDAVTIGSAHELTMPTGSPGSAPQDTNPIVQNVANRRPTGVSTPRGKGMVKGKAQL